MSVRSSILRSARPLLARTSVQSAAPATRRAASTSHGPSSNLPWALGSAVVFGGLTAFILMPSGQHAANTVHESVEAKGEGAHTPSGGGKPEHEKEEHANAKRLMQKERASGDRPTLDDDPKGKAVHATESRPRTEIPSKRDDEKPARRGPSTGADYDSDSNTVDGTAAKAGLANKSSDSDSGKSATDKAEDLKDQAKSKAEDVKDQAKSKADELKDQAKSKTDELKDKADDLKDQAKSKYEDVKDQAKSKFDDVKDQAKSKYDEVKGKAAGAVDGAKQKVDDATSDSGRDADGPSDKDVLDSIHQAERSNAPRAAMGNDA